MDGMSYPSTDTKIIEPFAGNKDMIQFIKNNKNNIIYYDIEPLHDDITEQDTLLNPPNYNNAYIITNPPYLARNKSKNKQLYELYNVNDLYKCFLKSICNPNNIPLGGIIIIPFNFWCSIRKNDCSLRKLVLQHFQILRVNVFEEQVFDDTSYTVCCIQFNKNINKNTNYTIPFIFYPSKDSYDFICSKDNDMIIGGEIYQLPQQSSISINRLKQSDIENNTIGITNIKVFCLDTNQKKPIRMEFVKDDDRFIDTTKKSSERSFATLLIQPPISIRRQKRLIEQFNTYINDYREQYKSLFLSNYRDSSDMCRKRISYKLVYTITNYLLSI
jgi:hypothetical protein